MISGRYMLHPESKRKEIRGLAQMYDKTDDLTPFEVQVVEVREMSFPYFARCTVGPGESHYDYSKELGAIYYVPGGDGVLNTCKLSELRVWRT